MEGEVPIRKDIPNRPIPFEIDRARQRELWRWGGILLPLAVVLIVWVWQRDTLVQHAFRLHELERALRAEQETTRKLRLEIETLRSPERIEALARTELDLVSPGREDTIVLLRVTPAPPPPASVVAAR